MRLVILHITHRSTWEHALSTGDFFRPDSLGTEGFIHCSTPEQIIGVANALFHGGQGLVLLVIDPALATADLVYEDSYETGQLFPHLYGPLNRDAVVDVIDFPPEPDGSFVLPAQFEAV